MTPALPFDTVTREQAINFPWLPGLQAGEAVIAKAWLASAGARYERFAFNVRVGQGADPPGDAPDYAKRFVKKVTQKRIDVVAIAAAGVALYEVKIQANLGALGQMLGYRHLWELEFPAFPVIEAGILCHLISVDTGIVYAKHGMPYAVFPDVVLPALVELPPPA